MSKAVTRAAEVVELAGIRPDRLAAERFAGLLGQPLPLQLRVHVSEYFTKSNICEESP